MKKLLLTLVFFGLLTTVLFANDMMVSKNDPMPGGYSQVSTSDKIVTDAVSFLNENFPAIKIDSVKKAYQQVVAGMNVKLVCSVKCCEKKETWDIVVYRDLKGNMFFTSAKNHK